MRYLLEVYFPILVYLALELATLTLPIDLEPVAVSPSALDFVYDGSLQRIVVLIRQDHELAVLRLGSHRVLVLDVILIHVEVVGRVPVGKGELTGTKQ